MVSAILTSVRGDVSSWDPDFAHRKMAYLLQGMSTIAKSNMNPTADPVVDYCAKHTVKQQPIQKELFESSMRNIPGGRMLGAPEVHTLGENLIHLIEGKKILDIGTLSGASALAWALAAGEGAKVYTLDITFGKYKEIGVPIISKNEEVFKRIITVEGPALESLDRFIAEGQSGTFDFAFIDADKENYPNYYERCVTLLRKGGVIMVDNALAKGSVTQDPSTFNARAKAIDEMNKNIYNDDRTYSAIFNTGDGIHLAFKK